MKATVDKTGIQKVKTDKENGMFQVRFSHPGVPVILCCAMSDGGVGRRNRTA